MNEGDNNRTKCKNLPIIPTKNIRLGNTVKNML